MCVELQFRSWISRKQLPKEGMVGYKEDPHPVKELPLYCRPRPIDASDKSRKVKSDILVTLCGPDESREMDRDSKSDIPVLKQKSYTGPFGVLPSATADIPCSELGVNGMLEKLRDLIHLVKLDDKACKYFIAKKYDFGTAYAHLHCNLYGSDIDRHITTTRKSYEEDRQDMLNNPTLTNNLPHRRTWDLHANRVVPSWVPDWNKRSWAISHAWVANNNLKREMTPINGYEWPVPMPKDADLNLIRIEMLNLGIEYVWLDVLCLRQEGRSEDPRDTTSQEEWDRREALRKEEWKIDMPMIGWVYFNAPVVACYFSGLGLPLSFKWHSDFQDDRCWFNRAWTLQETPDCVVIAGKTHDDGGVDEQFMTKDTQREFDNRVASWKEVIGWKEGAVSIFHILSHMRKRKSTKALDKVFGMAYLMHAKQIPSYNGDLSEEDVWTELMDVTTGLVRAEVFFFYPKPGNGNKAWRPSWQQVMDSDEKLPDVQDMQMLRGVEVDWSKEGGDSYNGPRIDACRVGGLADASEHLRHGELIVKNNSGVECTFRIVADHACPIGDGQYTLLGANSYQEHHAPQSIWVIGTIEQPAGGFKKVSVFNMADNEEAKRLVNLKVCRETETYLL